MVEKVMDLEALPDQEDKKAHQVAQQAAYVA